MTHDETLRELVQLINHAWVHGSPDDLAAYFSPDIVIAGPGLTGRIRGLDACIASYRDFAHQAVILDYEESNVAVDIFGDTAVVTYAYDIEYALGADEHRETGHDLFVFNRSGGQWQAVWRTLIPAVPEA